MGHCPIQCLDPGVGLAIKIKSFDNELNMKHFQQLRQSCTQEKSCTVREKGKHQWVNRGERGKQSNPSPPQRHISFTKRVQELARTIICKVCRIKCHIRTIHSESQIIYQHLTRLQPCTECIFQRPTNSFLPPFLSPHPTMTPRRTELIGEFSYWFPHTTPFPFFFFSFVGRGIVKYVDSFSLNNY